MKKSEELILEQERLNEKLAALFKANGIKNFRLSSLGNSIASGYSMVRTVKPLLLRNESLTKVMADNDIHVDTHHFARAQNNSDEHIYDWLATNVRESEIHKLNRNDYSGGPTSMPAHGLTQEQIDQYYPIEMENDMGLQDAVLESKADLANIVVYNGCTGSFLDNVTRNGKISQMLTYGIKRDTYGLEATLKFIQANNRDGKSNTQVYVCGAPNFLGLKISEVINVKLKKIVKKYANVVYVEPVKSKFFYETLEVSEKTDLEQAQNIVKKRLRQPDIHYDEDEYVQFNNNIIKSINNNYLVTQAMINIDRDLYRLSSNMEIENHDLLKDNDFIQQYLLLTLNKEGTKLPNNDSRLTFYKRAERYLLDREPYDFYYIGKKNIHSSVDKISQQR